jgi:membrane-associated phospholipid phosphatase
MTAAVAVAFSRVLIQRHFLSDMFAGLALELCIVVLIKILFDRCGIQLHVPQSRSNSG